MVNVYRSKNPNLVVDNSELLKWKKVQILEFFPCLTFEYAHRTLNNYDKKKILRNLAWHRLNIYLFF